MATTRANNRPRLFQLHSQPTVPTLDSLRISDIPGTPSAQTEYAYTSSTAGLRTSYSTSDLSARPYVSSAHALGGAPYTLSSNPPNPRTTFRVGDWICASVACAAHNFGRNTVCIGCGSPRPHNTLPTNAPTRPSALSLSVNGLPTTTSSNRVLPSPRFNSAFPSSHASPSPVGHFPRSPIGPLPGYPTQPASPISPMSTLQPGVSKAPLPTHPLLTPSGRALAVGGKVQNVSTDALSPCIMWWPDNEPLPEQGQIRPATVVCVPQPPILNTGNRGPIEHQPGDWVCGKCDYLNWRRRKVCQTCFPYAEGNGDSVSASVQAERVALLSAVLSQHSGHLSPGPGATRAPLSPLNTVSRLQPSPNPYGRQAQPISPSSVFGNIGSGRPMRGSNTAESVPHRQQHQQWLYQSADNSRFTPSPSFPPSPPIYETSGHRTPPSPFSLQSKAVVAAEHELTPVPGAHLPSFLHDFAAPSLSPTSTSSAEFSLEDYDDDPSSPIYSTSGFYAHDSRAVRGSSSTLSNPSANSSSSSVNLGANVRSIGNIWKLDGEESKAWPSARVPSPKEVTALPSLN